MSSSVYIILSGDNWASRSAGFLAVEIATGIALASCQFFVHSFRWTFRGKRDTFRTSLFILATLSAIIYFVLDLTNEGEEEDNALISSHYYVIYIFSELFFQLAEFAILVVIAQTVHQLAFRDFTNPASNRAVRLLPFILIGIVAAVSITLFGLFAGHYGYLANGISADNLVNVTIGFFITYSTVFTATSLYITGVAIFAAAQQRSKMSLLTLVVAISLMLRSLLYLVDMAVGYYSPNTSVAVNVNWAVSYLYDIITVSLYIGVTGIACTGGYVDPMPKTDSTIELSPSPRLDISV